ncbi:4-hydroxy-3-methylbut-2-enyl diphosphate reductase [Actinophytocola oryzae]|uniref:4-hydroxy-3-methylbut-2-enyl diphosphate reductase n=1 Tax=Actinophytocola oryzae TaxID=502181 RepID=A0A4V3FQ59_9PSEU|nr:4-hydroxy-3-methylbut-2-enyl diphosphate reductase [Actinophytocola oryzae]TDV35907.1 4-hydroxy-3-methylbut-2-enyl diphosphate reductase [Actinophytocola oryzae]
MEHERLTTTTPVNPGEVVVAQGLSHPVLGSVRCASAAVVGGALARRGIRVRYHRALNSSARVDQRLPVVRVTSWLDATGRARGFGVASAAGDTATATAVAEVMREWSSALRTRRLLVAGAPPTCHGARRAVRLVGRALAGGGAVYVWGRMVAESAAVEDLRRRGAMVVTDLDLVPCGATVVFPAHGVEPAVRAEAVLRGLTVVDATCPLAADILAEARRFAARGDTIVVIGRADHAVVSTLTGLAPHDTRVVQTVDDVLRLDIDVADPVSYLVAPGFPLDEAADVIAMLRATWPTVRAQHGLCHAATERAEVVDGLAAACDLLLVAGSDDCRDAVTIAERARAVGQADVHVVARVEDLRLAWLPRASTVGVTPALSAAPGTVDGIAEALSALGPLSVAHRDPDIPSQATADDYHGRDARSVPSEVHPTTEPVMTS